jgi:hypothetical protein
MPNESFKPELRLVFQGSIPFEEPAQAESWYNMLKEMVKTQSPRATLNGQVMKMLEPCCGERRPGQLPPGVSMFGPTGVRQT